MTNSDDNMTQQDLERLVIECLASRDPAIARRFGEDATHLQPNTQVMGDLLEIYAGECHLSQDRATAAWDMAAAVAAEGHPGGDDYEFDLGDAGARLVRDWRQRTEGERIRMLHMLTSLRIAVGMYFTACVENRLRYELMLLACGITTRIRYLARFGIEISRDTVDEFFHPWWYQDAMTEDDA